MSQKDIEAGGHSPAMPAHPREVVQGQLDAYNHRDIDEFVKWFAEDVEIFDLTNGKVLCSGNDALREMYSKLFADFPNLHCTIANRIVCGNFVIDEESVEGRLEGQTVHAAAIYEVKEGLIARFWFVSE